MLRPRLEILLAAALWSTGGAAIELCALDGWQIACGRSAVAAALLLLLVPAARARPSPAVLLVALAQAATMVLFVVGNKHTTSANAIFLQSTAPLYVLLAGPVFLGERVTRGEALAVPVFLTGLLLFFVDQLSPGQRLGNALALLSGVAFAACIVGLRRIGDDAAAATCWGNVLAAALALPQRARSRLPDRRC